jgi:hypothetical protein
MNKKNFAVAIAVLLAGTLAGCAGYYGEGYYGEGGYVSSGYYIAPPLPPVVVLDNPYYVYQGYHYYYDGGGHWFYTRHLGERWSRLPKDRWPHETRMGKNFRR